MGVVPGGGGTRYPRDRVGRNRAVEVILTADLFEAQTAASYGRINRALPAELGWTSPSGGPTPNSPRK
ncbi:enoyl-CoA hydratase/isomerase family protein [Streptomyces galilaeus]